MCILVLILYSEWAKIFCWWIMFSLRHLIPALYDKSCITSSDELMLLPVIGGAIYWMRWELDALAHNRATKWISLNCEYGLIFIQRSLFLVLCVTSWLTRSAKRVDNRDRWCHLWNNVAIRYPSSHYSRIIRLIILNANVGLILLTLMLLVDTLANTKFCKNPEKNLKPGQMGTYMWVLSESFSMNTTWQGLDDFQKSLRPCALDEHRHSIGRVKGFPIC